MAGNLLGMPMILVNMGGEMLYILEQRLKAQKIPEIKGQKVIADIVRTMFQSKFVAELFEPQEMYSMASTRQIFERLAHSSIMRLNESSMDKLFDLMTMGFKSQLIWLTCPEEILQVCMNHHEAICEMVESNPELLQLLNKFESLTQETYHTLTAARFQQLREELLGHFQNRKVKISLFLQGETQSVDGQFVAPNSGTLPVHVAQPGTITYADGRLVKIQLANDGRYAPNPAMDNRVSTQRYSSLGTNQYSKERTVTPYKGAEADMERVPYEPLPPPRDPQKGIRELNKMAELLGTLENDENNRVEFRLDNMFAGDIWSSPGEASGARVQVMRDGHANHHIALDKILSSLTEDARAPEQNQEEADLLSLIE
eukprot:GEMP01054703.1.p1 GENE.GEMP01054703.1~~GEMP01054703.1.p1  ORF type:complete len:371 (+),score=77.54 GEMP01054703.1:45-1157(+)